MTARNRMIGAVLAAVALGLGVAAPAYADGGTGAADVTVAQSLGERELTVVLRRVTAVPGPLHLDVVSHAGSPAGELRVEAVPAGEGAASGASLALPAAPGPVSATLRVDGPGAWELSLSDGEQTARIPFVVHAIALSPAERYVYGGFVAAGVCLAAGLVIALVARHPWWAVVPGSGVVGAVAVAVVAALLSASQPAPPAPGPELDPTVANAADPYAQVPRTAAFSRPPLTMTVRQPAAAVGVPAVVELDLTDAATGLPADDLVVHDSALLHLMVVSPSGRLWHLHPVRTAPGRFRVTITPDAGGTYAVAAEVARRGGGVQMLRAPTGFTARGQARDAAVTPLPARGSGTVDGVGVQTAMADPVAGSPVTLRARIGDEPDLQPWLGMLGHLIVVGPSGAGGAGGAAVWMHAHAMDDASSNHAEHGKEGTAMVAMPGALGLTLPDETVAAYGPGIGFTVTFPVAGRYRMWLQAEKDYRIITVPITVDVAPALAVAPPRAGTARVVRVSPETLRTGTRDVGVTVTARDGTPDPAPSLQVQAVLPTMGYASPVRTAVPRGRGRFVVTGLPLMAAGGWQLRLTSPGDEPLTVPITVTD